MRISVQLRSRSDDADERWQRTVYVDDVDQEQHGLSSTT